MDQENMNRSQSNPTGNPQKKDGNFKEWSGVKTDKARPDDGNDKQDDSERDIERYPEKAPMDPQAFPSQKQREPRQNKVDRT